MTKPLSLTIVICTYDRDRLLRKCLSALDRQSTPRDYFEILVIDNKGTAACRKACIEFDVRYVHEAKTGLSHARNTGYENTKTQWVLYLDDDGIPNEDLIEQFGVATSNPDIKIIGGRYSHYFEQDAPKWIHNYYQGFYEATDSDRLAKLKPGEHLSGGIMAISKSLLVETDGFNPDLGMSGKRFGYGEENEVQDKIRNLGYHIFYHPGMKMSHLVQPHKHSMRSRIQMAYAHGRDATVSVQKNKSIEFAKDVIRIVFITVPYDIGRILFRPNFRWQNGIISTLGKLAAALGRLQDRNTPLINDNTEINQKNT